MDPQVAASAIQAGATVLVAFIAFRANGKVKETHRQVTVNHHASEEPTLLDRISSLHKKLEDHLQWHKSEDEVK